LVVAGLGPPAAAAPARAAAACTVGGLAGSASKARRPWRPVPAPTSGPAGNATGQAPPVGLAVQLGEIPYGEPDTHLEVVHLDSGVIGVPGRHAMRRLLVGHRTKVPM